MSQTSNEMTLAMKAIIRNDLEAFTHFYKGKDDILITFNDNSGFHSIVSLICQCDSQKIFKPILIQILNDSISNNITIESPTDNNQEGVCHWCCSYLDLDVAKLMFSTPNVLVNRLDKSFKSGPARLAEKKGKIVIQLIQFLIENGFNINIRKDENSPSLLESFVSAMNIIYEAVDFLIKNGAKIDVFHSHFKNKETGEKISLIDYVNQRNDEKLKQLFG